MSPNDNDIVTNVCNDRVMQFLHATLTIGQ